MNKLLNTTVDEIVPQRTMIVMDSELTLSDAFSNLVKHNIYSAPIYDTKKKELLGFVDMLDIVVFLVNIIESEQGFPKNLGSQDFYALLEQVSKFRTEHVKAIADISKRNPMVPVSHNAPIKEVIKIFGNSGTHRVPVLSNPWTVNNVLSQTDIINWLAKNINLHKEGSRERHNHLGAISQKTVAEVFPKKDQVISIKGEEQAIEAFKLMAHYRITSVAVVDNNGALLSNLSAKDIKAIEPDAIFTKLYKTCTEFIAATRINEYDTHFPMIYCKQESTLEEVIQRLSFMKIHRIYVIDEHHKPINVISLGDILNVLFL